MSCDPDIAIDVVGLTKRFHGRTAVNRLTMQVRRGQIYGFLGPNGSGKTTTIRVLGGLLTPDEGFGTCLGHDIRAGSDAIKRCVGYMTQRFSLYEDLSIRENLEFVSRIYRLPYPERAARRMIEQMRLGARAGQTAGTLSGGWKQRLALAACMLPAPRLLLLDEPTAGVDPVARRDFWQEIHNLAADGLTVLVSTHYMEEAERCHEIAYIDSGHLVTTGTVDDVIAGSRLVTYTVTGERLTELAAEIDSCPGIDTVAPFGTSLHVSGRDERALEAATAPWRADPSWTWQRSRASLEDVFIDLMGNRRHPLIAGNRPRFAPNQLTMAAPSSGVGQADLSVPRQTQAQGLTESPPRSFARLRNDDPRPPSQGIAVATVEQRLASLLDDCVKAGLTSRQSVGELRAAPPLGIAGSNRWPASHMIAPASLAPIPQLCLAWLAILLRPLAFRGRVGAMFRKEVAHLLRDRVTLAMLLVFPLSELVMFGYAINTTPHDLPTAVLLREQTDVGRAILSALQNTRYFKITRQLEDKAELDRVFASGEALFAIEVPRGFERALRRGESPALLLVADATDPVTTGSALAALGPLVQSALQNERAVPPAAAAAFEIRQQSRYNPAGVSQFNIVPGLLGTILAIATLSTTALSVTREREQGTMESLLAMPISPFQIMLGKMLPYVVIAFLQAVLILSAGVVLFHVPVLGDLVLLGGLTTLFIITNLTVGYTLSTFAQSQLQAAQLSMVFMMPNMMLSGFMFPFAGMPGWAQAIGQCLPLTHFVRMVRAILLKGSALADLQFDALCLLALMLLTVTIATTRFRRTLD
jgi:ABC-2 type transport system permease protein